MAEILTLDQDGDRLIPLVSSGCSSKEAHAALIKQKASDLFPGARAPEAALAGLWLYFSCSDECHAIVQDLTTAEGSFWHGILHRQEPDPDNASNWYRRVGSHPVFLDLRDAAAGIVSRYPETGFDLAKKWDPFAFIEFCERARRLPDSKCAHVALEIQRGEWQLLFDYCARSRS